MRKHSTYKPKSKQELFIRLQSLINESKHMPLDKDILDKFKIKSIKMFQNLEQGTAKKDDILHLNGIIGLLKIIGANSNRLSLNDELELYLTAEPIRRSIAEKLIANGNVGYESDLESLIIIKCYNLILKNMEAMTNLAYDEFVNRLKQFQDKKGHLFIGN